MNPVVRAEGWAASASYSEVDIAIVDLVSMKPTKRRGSRQPVDFGPKAVLRWCVNGASREPAFGDLAQEEVGILDKIVNMMNSSSRLRTWAEYRVQNRPSAQKHLAVVRHPQRGKLERWNGGSLSTATDQEAWRWASNQLLDVLAITETRWK